MSEQTPDIKFFYDDQPAFPRDRGIIRILIIVAVIFYSLYLIMLRDIVFHLPQLMRGEMVMNGDELVPFFDVHTQFIDQVKGEFNDLTNGYEFRVRYSILTTWMRYYKVLPFALLFVVPTVAYGSYLAVSYFLQRVLPSVDKQAIFRTAAAPILLIYLILTYTKITHFYTLILGFGGFLIATLFSAYGLLFSRRHPYRYMAIGCFIAVLNPAIHYIILYSMFISLLVLGAVIMEGREYLAGGGFFKKLAPKTLWELYQENRKHIFDTFIARVVGMFGCLGAITLIPYAIFVKFFVMTGISNLSETIPVTYYFIKDASISFAHLVSFDLAGIMDKVLGGDYLTPHPRITNIVYTFILIMPLVLPPVKRLTFATKPLRAFFTISYLIMAFSFWATLGYSGSDYLPTFHRTIALISNIANNTRSTVGDLVVTLMGTIVQILRFPHRFQLILFMMACIVLPIGTLWLEEQFRKWPLIAKWPALRTPLFQLLFFLPLMLNWQYYETFFSGNFMGFLSPYPVTTLDEVKDYLLTLPEGKTVVLPPTETAKSIIDVNGVEHKFIDKFHIYYLDLPSYYYGLSGDPQNKHEFFLLLRAMYYEQVWWVNIARDNDVKYLIVNKELTANTTGGAEYLRGIEKTLKAQMDRLDEYYRLIFDNESYAVYELIDPPKANRIPLFLDMSWNKFISVQSRYPELSRYYDLRYGMVDNALQDYENLVVVSDDPRMAELDVYGKTHPTQFFRPDSIIFPFNKNITPSTYYIAPMFRMFQFFSDTKWNQLEMITPGMYGTITGTFIGVANATTFRIDVKIPEDGTYHLLMRGSSTANELVLDAPQLDIEGLTLNIRPENNNVVFFEHDQVFQANRQPFDISTYSNDELEKLIPKDLVAVNYRFQYIDLGVVTVPKGTYTIYFTKEDNNPILVEGVLVLPESEFEHPTLPGHVTLVTPEDKFCCALETQDPADPLPNH